MSAEPYEYPPKPNLSFSSYELFDECRRKWLYRYGLDHLPRQRTYTLRLLGKLSPWATFAGTIVDHAIGFALMFYRERREWPTDLRGWALKLAGDGWRFSQEWCRVARGRDRPPYDPRFQPMDRHYYADTISREETDQMKEVITSCLRHFEQPAIRDWIEATDPAWWKGPRSADSPLPWYWLGEVPVWAVHDFGVLDPELCWLVDWKTGMPTDRSMRRAGRQLNWYALYAEQVWDVPQERIRLAPAWLRVDQPLRWTEADAGALDDVQGQVQRRFQELIDRLDSSSTGPGGTVDEEAWEFTPYVWKCGDCQFRGVCPGAQRQTSPKPEEEIDPFAD